MKRIPLHCRGNECEDCGLYGENNNGVACKYGRLAGDSSCANDDGPDLVLLKWRPITPTFKCGDRFMCEGVEYVLCRVGIYQRCLITPDYNECLRGWFKVESGYATMAEIQTLTTSRITPIDKD